MNLLYVKVSYRTINNQKVRKNNSNICNKNRFDPNRHKSKIR